MKKTVLAAVLPCIFVVPQAFAAVSECDGALILSTYNSLEASKSDWRMARHVDEGTYSQVKNEAGGSAVIYGIPMGANYSEFEENIRNYSNSENESLTQEQFRNVAWTGLGDSAADAYKTCIKSQSRGIAIVPDRATDSDITFRVSYSPIGGSANPLPVTWFGAESGSNVLPTQVSAGETIVILKRPDKSSTLALNSADASGFSDSVILTPLPKEEPSQKFASRCVITKTPNPAAVTRGHSFSWTCPRMRAGTYLADLSVVPSAARAVRVGWSAELRIGMDQGEKDYPLETTSGGTIDVGIPSGIGTTFESRGNLVTIPSSDALPVFTITIQNTAWHGDFSQPSDDPIQFPADVTISLERQ